MTTTPRATVSATPGLCRHCGRPLPEVRLGVPLSKLKAHIFDVVRRAGVDGIDGDELRAIVFADREVGPATLKAHTFQINDLIADAGHRIAGGGGRYRLVKT